MQNGTSRPMEQLCAWCGRNLSNLNEYVERGSVRWNNASHGICKSCIAILDKKTESEDQNNGL